MRIPVRILVVATGIVATGMLASAADPPSWAYPRVPSDVRVDPDDGKPRSVPGSTRTYTLTQIRDFFAPPDWYDDHPPMPGIVGRGRPPMAFACGYCHLPSGIGKPENARVAGLQVAYIKQQVADFKSGARKSSAPGMLPHVWMVEASKAATDEEVDESRSMEDWIGGRDASFIGMVAAQAAVIALGLFLSAMSIFSLVSVSVSQRRREIGVRTALGARPRQLLAGIMSRAIVLTGTGITAGGVLLLLFVAENGPTEDVALYAGYLGVTSAVMLAACLLACIGPARRALGINPTDALREA